MNLQQILAVLAELAVKAPALIKILAELVALFGGTLPADPVKALQVAKEAGCGEEACALLEALCCQRRHLLEALKHNCEMECCIGCHDHKD